MRVLLRVVGGCGDHLAAGFFRTRLGLSASTTIWAGGLLVWLVATGVYAMVQH
ncbi:MAG: hypothetical protein M1602_02445 [Firmicutes bacterium]|nr:hypothetical protein [Bacillota bacterium]